MEDKVGVLLVHSQDNEVLSVKIETSNTPKASCSLTQQQSIQDNKDNKDHLPQSRCQVRSRR